MKKTLNWQDQDIVKLADDLRDQMQIICEQKAQAVGMKFLTFKACVEFVIPSDTASGLDLLSINISYPLHGKMDSHAEMIYD